MKIYGNIQNRFDENKMYCKTIEKGTRLTEYLWSDRHAYEVVEVISQTDVVIRRLNAIRTDNYGMSDAQNYRYESDLNASSFEIVFKKGKWRKLHNVSKNELEKLAMKHPVSNNFQTSYNYYLAINNLTDNQKERLEQGKTIIKYGEPMNISFGIADEYFDYSF